MKKIFLILFLILPTFSSLLRPGYFPIQDNMQPFRIYQLFRCFQDYQLPCHWVPDMGFGYGYPLFLFYAPGPYYLGAILSFVFSYIDAVKILFVFGFVISGFAMYLLAREYFQNKYSALVSTVLYLYLPVRAVQVYVRGSLSEFLSLTLFPLVFWSFLKLSRVGSKKYFIISSFALAGLILTHNLMSYVFFPLLLLWIFMNFRKATLIRAVLSLLVSLGLTAFFILPLIFERNNVHLETLIGGYFGYQQHFVSLYRLFISQVWGYGSSAVDSPNHLNLSVGHIHWLLALISFIIALLKKNKTILILGLLELGVLFMMHAKSTPIWQILPQLSYLQFPWRFLTISGFLTSFLAGYVIIFQKNNYQKIFSISIIVTTSMLYGSFFIPKTWWPNYTDAELFKPAEFTRQQTTSLYDYLPKSARVAPPSASLSKPVFILGTGEITNYTIKSSSQVGEILVSTPAQLQLPIYDFPGMVVKLDNNRIDFTHDDYGLINIQVPVGKHQLSVSLANTPDRQAGNIISILSVLAISIFALI